ncbi:hypothetical protein M5D96_000410, partial [Drosophila gunungcola]
NLREDSGNLRESIRQANLNKSKFINTKYINYSVNNFKIKHCIHLTRLFYRWWQRQRHSIMRRHLTFCQKYQLLLWKDIKLQLANVIEFVLIILLAALMPLLITIGTKVAKSMFHFDIELEKAPGPKSIETSLFKDIYFSPYNGLIENLIYELANISDFTQIESFDATETLQKNMIKNQKAVGIVFPSDWESIKTLPDALNFTLYMPVYIKSNGFKYFESGFLLLQERLSQLFIKLKNKGGKNIPMVRMNHFPYPRYVPNHYAKSAKFMAYMYLVSFFLPCITIAKLPKGRTCKRLY